MPSRGITGALCQPVAEVHYEWKVENVFILSAVKDDWYNSPDIQISGRTFNLLLLPKSADLYLELRTTSHPITIQYTLGIKTAAGDTEVLTGSGTCEFSTSKLVCYLTSITRTKLWNRRQQLAPCGALTITANLKTAVSRPDIGTTGVAVQTSVEDAGGQEASGGRQAVKKSGIREVAVQTSEEYAAGQEVNGGHQTLGNTDIVTLSQSFKNLYVAGKNCDVTLEVKDQKFRAHKLILGARTPVLAAMFSHKTTEAETGIVRVEDCDPEAFEVFLKFVYSDAAEDLTGQNVTNVYYVADKYDLPGLKKECVRHMISNLTTGSVCSVVDLAERHGEELLQEKATEFFVENAREIFRTATWRKLMAENNGLANNLIIRGYESSK